MNSKIYKRPKNSIFLVFLTLFLSAFACAEYPGVPRQFSGYSGNLSLPPASSAGGLSGSTSGSQTFADRNVELELRDFEIFPSDFTVPAGEITFNLDNIGRYTHDFRIEGEGIDEKSPRIAAGRSGEWTITLTSGVYNISCPLSNHADRGMIGTLTVTS